jgi:hypothetical protein
MRTPTLHTESMIRTYVVYDIQSGEIVHIHEYLALPGVVPPSDAEIENEACMLASKRTGKPTSEMSSLHIRRDALEIGVLYSVDLENKNLVANKRSTRKTT